MCEVDLFCESPIFGITASVEGANALQQIYGVDEIEFIQGCDPYAGANAEPARKICLHGCDIGLSLVAVNRSEVSGSAAIAAVKSPVAPGQRLSKLACAMLNQFDSVPGALGEKAEIPEKAMVEGFPQARRANTPNVIITVAHLTDLFASNEDDII